MRDEGAALRRASAPAAAAGPGAATIRRERNDRLNGARNRLRTVEKQIAALDSRKAELTRQLGEPQSYTPELGTQLAELADGVERLEREWLTLSEQIEALTNEQGQKAGNP